MRRLFKKRLDGTKWTYTSGVMTGADYALTKIADRSGNFIDLVYQSGYLWQVINSDGAFVTIEADIRCSAM